MMSDRLPTGATGAAVSGSYSTNAVSGSYLSNGVNLDPPYELNIPPVAAWLPSVERRIEDSIIPKEFENIQLGQVDFKATIEPAEWLREDVGRSAVRFFQSAADILPSEPFIYASQSGALVAEFQTPAGALTTVISLNNIILFAAKTDEPSAPIQVTLNRGTNRLREELREVVRTIAVSHGQMGSTR
jgi:hypothetical protein